MKPLFLALTKDLFGWDVAFVKAAVSYYFCKSCFERTIESPFGSTTVAFEKATVSFSHLRADLTYQPHHIRLLPLDRVRRVQQS
jgi:hypothetical protein